MCLSEHSLIPHPQRLAKRKRKPTLDELARLIRESYESHQFFANASRQAGRVAIEIALNCGGYFREAKVRLRHGQFETWVKRNTPVSLRTAHNWRKLHKWLSTNPNRSTLLSDRTMTLRRLFVLAEVLPGDKSKSPPKEPHDELSKLRKLYRRAQLEGAANLGGVNPAKLLSILEPTIELAAQIRVQIAKLNRQHGADFDVEE